MLSPFLHAGKIEAGCDEAGRGCLAGPVVAAAVILPDGFSCDLLNDSKQMTEAGRDKVRMQIESEAIAWAVAFVSEVEIDKINILKASILAMQRAVAMLSTQPKFLLIDGNRFTPVEGIPHQCIIKGDALYMSIAAASVLAKTHRDDHMKKIHAEYPMYRWDENKGYPTVAHRNAIREHGDTDYHRKSFRLLPHPPQGKLF